MTTNQPFFQLRQTFTDKNCFLCGVTLTKREGDPARSTEEHVIPRWLQSRHQLYQKKMTLLNGTTIFYAALKIPCCYECNHDRLAPLEEKVKTAVEAGPDAVEQLDPWTLFYWLGKIYYGLLFRELSLVAERSDPNSNKIMTPDILEQFAMHHALMQKIRGVIDCADESFPASIYILECQELLGQPEINWDYGDAFVRPYLSLRMGRVGIIAFLQDWGVCEDSGPLIFQSAKGLALHPIQFRYLMGWGHYTANAYRRTNHHLSFRGESSITTISPPVPSLSNEHPYIQDDRILAEVLSAVMQQPLESIYRPGQLLNAIQKGDGTHLHIPLTSETISIGIGLPQ